LVDGDTKEELAGLLAKVEETLVLVSVDVMLDILPPNVADEVLKIDPAIEGVEASEVPAPLVRLLGVELEAC
jgi:hypothetical protein